MFFERDFLVKQEQINDLLRQRELERQAAATARSTRMHYLRRSGQLVRRLLASRPLYFRSGATESC